MSDTRRACQPTPWKLNFTQERGGQQAYPHSFQISMFGRQIFRLELEGISYGLIFPLINLT
jgi:hypothetical protein